MVSRTCCLRGSIATCTAGAPWAAAQRCSAPAGVGAAEHTTVADPAAAWLPREARRSRTRRDSPERRRCASLRGHCRIARWLMISACVGRVRVPLRARTKQLSWLLFLFSGGGHARPRSSLRQPRGDLVTAAAHARGEALNGDASWARSPGALGAARCDRIRCHGTACTSCPSRTDTSRCGRARPGRASAWRQGSPPRSLERPGQLAMDPTSAG